MRHILLYQDEDDAWIVECPSLPGCYSQGEEIPVVHPLEVEQVAVQVV
jgi:predicted RNase H-like HicB family nuclease